MISDRIRSLIACYAAAITIILRQLNTQPDTTVPETPTPLVRVRHSFAEEFTWHPDELLTNASGGRSVLVWAPREDGYDEYRFPRISSN